MARDYKPRTKNQKKGGHHSKIGPIKWILVAVLIIVFIIFLSYLRLSGSKHSQENSSPATVVPTEKKLEKSNQKPPQETDTEKKPDQPKPPHFEFYTVLPQKELLVPEHEIKTRRREELVGKAKESKYVMQAGAYPSFQEADQLRAKLALMGFESKIEKAKVGDSVSFRVKMGPYTQMTSVDIIKKRLKKNGIDAIVTESGVKILAPARQSLTPDGKTITR